MDNSKQNSYPYTHTHHSTLQYNPPSSQKQKLQPTYQSYQSQSQYMQQQYPFTQVPNLQHQIQSIQKSQVNSTQDSTPKDLETIENYQKKYDFSKLQQQLQKSFYQQNSSQKTEKNRAFSPFNTFTQGQKQTIDFQETDNFQQMLLEGKQNKFKSEQKTPTTKITQESQQQQKCLKLDLTREIKKMKERKKSKVVTVQLDLPSSTVSSHRNQPPSSSSACQKPKQQPVVEIGTGIKKEEEEDLEEQKLEEIKIKNQQQLSNFILFEKRNLWVWKTSVQLTTPKKRKRKQGSSSFNNKSCEKINISSQSSSQLQQIPTQKQQQKNRYQARSFVPQSQQQQQKRSSSLKNRKFSQNISRSPKRNTQSFVFN